MSSPDYRAEADLAPPPARYSRWPGVVMALVVLAILTTAIVVQIRTAAPPQNVQPVAFEIRLAEPAPGTGLTEATVRDDPKQTVYLHSEPLITHEDLISATVIEMYGQPAIEFSTDRAAAPRMRHATATNFGKQLAILIDGEVWSAPRIGSEIGGKGVIMGNFSAVEAERVAAGIMQHARETGGR